MYRVGLCLFILSFAVISSVSGVFWSSSVDTNSSHWYVYRESSNLSFNLISSVEGRVSSIDVHGRTVSPYQSYYEEVGNNDVKLRKRTSALTGDYKSSDEIMMQSTVYPDEIEIKVNKPVGSEIYKIEYKNEVWPVIIKNKRTLAYTGLQINDRNFNGNNGDFSGTSFLHNRELFKEQASVLWIQRFNASVLATNDSIILAEFKPTKYLGDITIVKSNGISDLSYRFRDYRYDIKHQTYPSIFEGDERYYGTYNLSQKIEMRSLFQSQDATMDSSDNLLLGWLPCCKDF